MKYYKHTLKWSQIFPKVFFITLQNLYFGILCMSSNSIQRRDDLPLWNLIIFSIKSIILIIANVSFLGFFKPTLHFCLICEVESKVGSILFMCIYVHILILIMLKANYEIRKFQLYVSEYFIIIYYIIWNKQISNISKSEQNQLQMPWICWWVRVCRISE